MHRNIWTTVVNCRTIKCTFMVNRPDKMDKGCRYKVSELNEVASQCMCTYVV